MARNYRRDERDMSYGGFYGTSSDGGYTRDYDNQNRSAGRDGGREMGAGRSMRGNDYYRDADEDFRGYDRSHTFGAHARGDMSGGTRYGEGGSTYGGGSGYGHSNYGSRNMQHYDRNPDRYRHESGGSEEYTDYEGRNYGSYGGSRVPDYHRYGQYNTGGREGDFGYRDYDRNSYDRSTGYDRSFRDMPRGYGSTGYNERDQDRERSAWSRRDEDRYRNRYND